MLEKIWIAITLVVLGFVLDSCRVILNKSTKNWRMELVNIQTDDYKVLINANMSTICPKSKWMLGGDSIRFDNSFFPSIIKTLVDKTTSRTEFVNMKFQKDLKLDIYYYLKKHYELKLNKDTLLNILAKRIRFTVSSDSITTKVYSIKNIDRTKLMNHVDNSGISRTRLPKNKVEVYSSTLPSIFNDLESNIKIYFDYNLNDTSRYKMVIPRDNINNLLTYFIKECGIEFVEKEMKVEITRVVFNDKK